MMKHELDYIGGVDCGRFKGKGPMAPFLYVGMDRQC